MVDERVDDFVCLLFYAELVCKRISLNDLDSLNRLRSTSHEFGVRPASIEVSQNPFERSRTVFRKVDLACGRLWKRAVESCMEEANLG